MAVLNSAHIGLAVLAALFVLVGVPFVRIVYIAWIMRTDQRTHIESTYETSPYGGRDD